ncbi:MAG: MarR family transcriptional regulator [Bryobacteraceae bacterium]|nr:MarR family transcriptional regulator [Bryobacterales bacterium]MEB2362964.1 MarR family transcriptional regulator [Bryobacterales bacterium]NUN03882.1 MarR family transcriptional regulator [Bryobacteraceae bacterium]
MSASTIGLAPDDYQALAEFRYQIRRFLQFSEHAARESGVEPRQHQALLAIRGMKPEKQPTIGEIATRLFLRHHSAVELVNRLEQGGLVVRERHSEDGRQVLVRLTPAGERVLRRLSITHREELQVTGPELARALQRLTRRNRKSEAA